jgi:hypothetical protein
MGHSDSLALRLSGEICGTCFSLMLSQHFEKLGTWQSHSGQSRNVSTRRDLRGCPIKIDNRSMAPGIITPAPETAVRWHFLIQILVIEFHNKNYLVSKKYLRRVEKASVMSLPRIL